MINKQLFYRYCGKIKPTIQPGWVLAIIIIGIWDTQTPGEIGIGVCVADNELKLVLIPLVIFFTQSGFLPLPQALDLLT